MAAAVRVGVIGYGSMARKVIEVLERDHSQIGMAGVFTKNPAKYPPKEDLPFCGNLSELMALKPDVVVECATQEAVSTYAPTILSTGTSLIVASIGALSNTQLYEHLVEIARKSRASLILPAGAVGAIDALAAARFGCIHSVLYRGTKPASAWKSSPAEHVVDLDSLTEPQTVFLGNARDAAHQFPKNSNVAATIALAGLGFEKTRVELVADPNSDQNRHQIVVESDSSSFDIQLSGKPSADNPRTSILSALSVARSIVNVESALVL